MGDIPWGGLDKKVGQNKNHPPFFGWLTMDALFSGYQGFEPSCRYKYLKIITRGNKMNLPNTIPQKKIQCNINED